MLRRYIPASDALTLGFFVCGIFNNFAYVVMLSASKSLLASTSYSSSLLLTDDFPALIAQIISPVFLRLFVYRTRVFAIVCATVLSLSLAAYAASKEGSPDVSLALLAVSITSICFGFGESTFFSLLSFHSDEAIGAFSSGTGCAGVLGSGIYLFLIGIVSPPVALYLLAMLLPLHWFSFIFFVLPEHRKRTKIQSDHENGVGVAKLRDGASLLPTTSADEVDGPTRGTSSSNSRRGQNAMSAMLQNVRALWKSKFDILRYFVPLWVMYVATYATNHALLPHVRDLSNRDGLGTTERYYVSLYLTYQVAVFAARSSLKIIKLRSIGSVWSLVLVQLGIFLIVLALTFDWLPSAPYFVETGLYVVVLLEGLVSGLVYVNTFALLRSNTSARVREVVMGIVVCATTAGPIAASLLGMYIEARIYERA